MGGWGANGGTNSIRPSKNCYFCKLCFFLSYCDSFQLLSFIVKIFKYCTCINSVINARTIAVNSFLSWVIWNDNFGWVCKRLHQNFHKFIVVRKFLLIEDVKESMQMIFNLFLLSFQQFIFFVILCNHIFTLFWQLKDV